MPRIGNLVLGVVADTAKADRNLKRTQKQFRLTASTANKAATALKGFIAGMVGIAGARAGVRMLLNTAQAMDDVAKNAKRLGIAAEELQGLNFAVQIFGVTQEELTKAIVRQQKSISEATVGLSTQVRAYRELRINVERFQQLKPEEQFIRTLEAIGKQRLETNRLRIANDIFGRAGFKLLEIAKGNTEEFRRLTKEVKTLGASFSGPELEKAEKFNDAMLRLKTALGGSIQGLVIDVSPAAVRITNNLTRLLAESKQQGTTANRVLFPQSLSIAGRLARESVNRFPAAQQQQQQQAPLVRQAVTGAGGGLGAAGNMAINALGLGNVRGIFLDVSEGAEEFNKRIRSMAMHVATVDRFQIKKIRQDNEAQRVEQKRIADAKNRQDVMDLNEKIQARRKSFADRVVSAFQGQQLQGGRPARLSPLALQGTVQAANAIRRNVAGKVSAGGKKSIEDIAREQLAEDKKLLILQTQALEAIKALGGTELSA